MISGREKQQEDRGEQRGSPYMERKATQVILSHRHARCSLGPTHTHIHTHDQNSNTRVQIHISHLAHFRTISVNTSPLFKPHSSVHK